MLKKIFSFLEKSEDFLPGWCFPDNKKTRTPVDFEIEANESNDIDRIILVTLDTLRADHLGCYGYARPLSPFIDALAAHGILFQQAVTSMSTTVPAHASLFTSLHPIQHNVLKNGHRMNDSWITLAEQLRNFNYLTAAFVSTDRHFVAGNLHKGFEVFDEPNGLYHVYRRSRHTINKTIAWLNRRRSSDRFFLWVHLFDPHAPYKTSVSTCKVIRRETPEQRRCFMDFLVQEHQVRPEFYDHDEKKMLEVINAYDAEVFYLDRHLQRLFSHLRQKKLGLNTLWILVGDHGEGLGCHNWMAHGKHLYKEQIHIPLIFYFSSRSLRRVKVAEVVELVDIFPTVMELIGQGTANQHQPIEGRSLLPLFSTDGGKYDKEYAFVQRRHYDKRADNKRIDPHRDNYEEGEKYALLDGNYKYIWRTAGDDEFYCRTEDPYESNNLIGKGLPEEKKLKDILCQKVENYKDSSDSPPESVDVETIERLKELGYYQ